MSKKSTEVAAGGLIWRDRDGTVEVLVAHRPRYSDWAFPKGKVDGDESLIECALREVWEETGFKCRVGRYLGTTEFTRPSGRDKEVSYWAMQAVGGAFTPNGEVDQIVWVAVSDLDQRLSYALDIEFVTSLERSWTSEPNRILLTRHAHAGDRATWKGDDAVRPLSARGYEQAKGLVDQLAPFGIDRIVSSPAVRCLETVEPLAANRSLVPKTSNALSEEAKRSKIHGALEKHRFGSTLLCTHGPVLGVALHHLLKTTKAPMKKGSTWVLDYHGHQLAQACYLSPPS